MAHHVANCETAFKQLFGGYAMRAGTRREIHQNACTSCSVGLNSDAYYTSQ